MSKPLICCAAAGERRVCTPNAWKHRVREAGGGLGGICRLSMLCSWEPYAGTRMLISLPVPKLPQLSSTPAVLACTKHTDPGSQRDEKPLPRRVRSPSL